LRGQRPNEQIIIFARRHWIRNALFIAYLVGLDLAYLVAIYLIINFTPLQYAGTTRYIIITLSAIVLMTSWLLFYIRWLDYYLDIWILTNDRIVQIKQNSLFDRQIAGFDLSTIQDVVAKQKGPLATFLNYGTIFVQTAATTELFMFNFIPNPFEVKNKVLDAQEKLEVKAKSELEQMVSSEETAEKSAGINQDKKKYLKRGFKGIK